MGDAIWDPPTTRSLVGTLLEQNFLSSVSTFGAGAQAGALMELLL